VTVYRNTIAKALREELGTVELTSHPPVIMRRHLDDPQLVISYGGAEFRSPPGRPRRCGSESRWQIWVTANDGITRRDQFAARKDTHRA
jgi:hypothetical protein